MPSFRLRRLVLPPRGPLTQPTAIEFGRVTLVYGRNETGKTTLLDNLAGLLLGFGNLKRIALDRDPEVFCPPPQRGQSAVLHLETELDGAPLVLKKKEGLTEPAGLAGILPLLIVRAAETLILHQDPKGSPTDSNSLREYLRTVVSVSGLLEAHQANLIKSREAVAGATGKDRLTKTDLEWVPTGPLNPTQRGGVTESIRELGSRRQRIIERLDQLSAALAQTRFHQLEAAVRRLTEEETAIAARKRHLAWQRGAELAAATARRDRVRRQLDGEVADRKQRLGELEKRYEAAEGLARVEALRLARADLEALPRPADEVTDLAQRRAYLEAVQKKLLTLAAGALPFPYVLAGALLLAILAGIGAMAGWGPAAAGCAFAAAVATAVAWRSLPGLRRNAEREEIIAGLRSELGLEIADPTSLEGRIAQELSAIADRERAAREAADSRQRFRTLMAEKRQAAAEWFAVRQLNWPDGEPAPDDLKRVIEQWVAAGRAEREQVESRSDERLARARAEEQDLNTAIADCAAELRTLGIGEADRQPLAPAPENPFTFQQEQENRNALAAATQQLEKARNGAKAAVTELVRLLDPDAGDQALEAAAADPARLMHQAGGELATLAEKESAALAWLAGGGLMARVLADRLQAEDTALEQAVGSPEVEASLRRLTAGGYTRVVIESETQDGDPAPTVRMLFERADRMRFDLSGLSTGARDQVSLALRIGIARYRTRLAAGAGQPPAGYCFVLDDAFQHSDWPHRAVLVAALFALAADGWQSVYLTMDDHVRDLFIAEAGRRRTTAPIVPDDFRYYEYDAAAKRFAGVTPVFPPAPIAPPHPPRS